MSEPQAGIEPATSRLQGEGSTVELLWQYLSGEGFVPSYPCDKQGRSPNVAFQRDYANRTISRASGTGRMWLTG